METTRYYEIRLKQALWKSLVHVHSVEWKCNAILQMDTYLLLLIENIFTSIIKLKYWAKPFDICLIKPNVMRPNVPQGELKDGFDNE